MIIKCLDINNKIIYLNSDTIISIWKENGKRDYYVFEALDIAYTVTKVLGTYDNFKNFIHGVFGG